MDPLTTLGLVTKLTYDLEVIYEDELELSDLTSSTNLKLEPSVYTTSVWSESEHFTDEMNYLDLDIVKHDLEDIKKPKVKDKKVKKGKKMNSKLKSSKLTKSRRMRSIEKVRTGTITLEECARERSEERRSARFLRAPYRCDTCVVGFQNEDKLNIHNKKHNKVSGNFYCEICQIREQTASQMKMHMTSHVTRYECRACVFTDRHLKCVLRHYKSKHEGRTFTCNICAAQFSSERTLRYHKDSSHKEKIKCEHCGKCFQMRPNYKRHLLQHTGMPLVECTICHKSYRGVDGLRAHHRLQHSERAPEPAYCAECNIHFKNAYNYRAHMRTNSKHIDPATLRFPCPECDKKFHLECHFKRHYNTIHLKLANIICQFCSKAYCSRQALRMHVKSIHEQKSIVKDKVCDHCAKSFTTRTALQNHIRTHTGERPFSCTLCPATFARSATLYTHNKTVHLKLKRNNTFDYSQ